MYNRRNYFTGKQNYNETMTLNGVTPSEHRKEMGKRRFAHKTSGSSRKLRHPEKLVRADW